MNPKRRIKYEKSQCERLPTALPENNGPEADYTEFKLATTGKGNNVECRFYHAVVAGLSQDNAITHCPHAKFESDVCVDAPGSTSAAVNRKTWTTTALWTASVLGALV